MDTNKVATTDQSSKKRGRPALSNEQKALKKHGRGRAAGETTTKIINLPLGAVRSQKCNEIQQYIREVTKTTKKNKGKFVPLRVLLNVLIAIAIDTTTPETIALRALSFKQLDEQAHEIDLGEISPNSENEIVL